MPMSITLWSCPVSTASADGSTRTGSDSVWTRNRHGPGEPCAAGPSSVFTRPTSGSSDRSLTTCSGPCGDSTVSDSGACSGSSRPRPPGCPGPACCPGPRCRSGHRAGRLVHVVRGEDHGHALLAEFGDPLVHEQPRLRIQTGGRFVQEQHARPVDQRPGDHHPLHLTARQVVDLRLPVVGQPHPLQQFVGPQPALRPRHPAIAGVEHQVLADRQRPVQIVALRYDREHPLGLAGPGHHIHPVDLDPTRGRQNAGGHHAHGGALSGAVRPEQAEHLTPVHIETETVHHAPRIRRILFSQLCNPDSLIHSHNPKGDPRTAEPLSVGGHRGFIGVRPR
ncbi:hypothetical protein SALBM311S_08757 [Streptomyces alboniger]